METLEQLIIFITAAVILVEIAQKLGVPYPIVLIGGGTLISFVPGTHRIHLDPNMVLLMVLPPVLYYTAFWISNREFRKNLREIVSLALGLVIFTTIVVACLFKWFFPELPWALAFVFGAIISPPDATTSKAVLKRFSLPTRLASVLEGESLVNDATAIVLYKVSLVALASGGFSLIEIGDNLAKNVIGGVGIGFILGYGMQLFSRYLLSPVVAVIFSFTIPYVTYIVADRLDVSGVLAVVVSGLIGSRIVSTHVVARRRILAFAAWDVFFIFLNCFIFVLIGIQLRHTISIMTLHEAVLLTLYGIIITGFILLVRFVWIYLYKALVDWKKGRFISSMAFKEGVIMGWSSMRGIVSLALALALPYSLPDNGRSIILHLTFVVILLTLLLTGLSLPYVIQKLKIPLLEKDSAALKTTRVKLRELADKVIEEMELEDSHKKLLNSYFSTHHAVLNSSEKDQLEKARLKILEAQRSLLVELWKKEEVEDHELTLLQQELDLEITHIVRGEID